VEVSLLPHVHARTPTIGKIRPRRALPEPGFGKTKPRSVWREPGESGRNGPQWLNSQAG
jgi:hypothetical protein